MQAGTNDSGGPVDGAEAPPAEILESNEPEPQPDTGLPAIQPAPAPATDVGQAECLSVSPTIAKGREEVDAALCFGLTYPAAFECVYSPVDDVTRCSSSDAQYVVVWAEEPAAVGVPSSKLGRVSDEVGGQVRALVYRIEDGSYLVEWGNGVLGKCDGVVGEFCLYSP